MIYENLILSFEVEGEYLMIKVGSSGVEGRSKKDFSDQKRWTLRLSPFEFFCHKFTNFCSSSLICSKLKIFTFSQFTVAASSIEIRSKY